jgi:CHAT domain-containing protein
MLTGPSATPSSVLAAIADAGEVVVHAHGVVGQLDSSYIALSPDSSGRFALAAREVRAAQFKTSPLVVLAACRSSQAAPVIHEAWSLPTAFVYAGARAVIASSSPMPDDEAARFFDDLDQRIGHGAAVATALRDSRMAWTGGDWVNDLVVFE